MGRLRALNWLGANWLSIAGIVVGVWVALALRPRPLIRYSLTSDQTWGSYRLGSSSTHLYVRNAGTEPITAERWRTPLILECDTEIQNTVTTGVSHRDITTSVNPVTGNPNAVQLVVSHLQPGDAVAFNIRHDVMTSPPRLSAELAGSRDALRRQLTVPQRLAVVAMALCVILPLDYVEILCTALLMQNLSEPSHVLQSILYALASPLPLFISFPLISKYGKPSTERAAQAAGCMAIVFLLIVVLRFFAVLVAWLSGERLWYPEFAVFVTAQMLVFSLVGGRHLVAGMGFVSLRSSTGWRIIGVTTILGTFAFAFATSAGINGNALVLIGVICTLIPALARLDRETVRARLKVALGDPRGRLQPPH